MKYFVCLNCGELTTSEKIDNELSNGGMGYCDCEYMQYQWDSKSQCFEPIYFRIYRDWTEIPEKVYVGLQMVKNTVERLGMLSTVSKQDMVI
jgi:hypothetical protein